MNEIVKAPARRKWTLDELDRLAAHGFFAEQEHVELIGGELYEMAPKGIRHENVRALLADWIVRRLPDGISLHVELGWRPESHYLEPDLILCPTGKVPPLTPPEAVILLIEVANSSLAHDQGLKAQTYAGLGVREYWVIDSTCLTTRVHLEPCATGYRSIADVAAGDRLVPSLMPSLAVRLYDIDFGSESLEGST